MCVVDLNFDFKSYVERWRLVRSQRSHHPSTMTASTRDTSYPMVKDRGG